MEKVNLTMEELDYSAEEAYKTLRTNLKFCGEDKTAIAVTSCVENEGKSSVSMNLCRSLAESGQKVILVDADLRKSVLLGRSKVSQEIVGLTHFLSSQAQMANVIYSTNVEGFDIIFAGPSAPNPAELLGNAHFSELLQVLKKNYDYVIIDTPPLGVVIDSAIIAQQCDGTIIVIESGIDSYRFVRSVKEQLEKAQCPILGVVLNKVDVSKASYYGRYGRYGKYGKYGKYGGYGQYGNYGNSTKSE